MFSFFKKQPQKEETPKPKYILEPRANGNYYLKQLTWQYDADDGDYQFYKIVCEAKNEVEGRQMIANLERPTIAVG